MKVADLTYDYPEDLVGTEPQNPSRVMWVDEGGPVEISLEQLIEKIPAGDILVLNNTEVLKRRVFAGELEILFLKNCSELEWEVLFPSRKLAVGSVIELPVGVKMTLKQKGRPQLVEVSELLTESYFEQVGELPLPPYIQKAREARHNVEADEEWYQTAFAKKPGSFAAPTASLHFKSHHLEALERKGVELVELTLHVGLGTFLPVTAEDLDDHDMHEEYVEIPAGVWQKLKQAHAQNKKIWALGTTATRSIESAALGMLTEQASGDLSGFTKLLIQPGYEFKLTDCLLTNFHQPQSTLMALVGAFAGLGRVKECYQWAIARKMKLFSYGDLSVWSEKCK